MYKAIDRYRILLQIWADLYTPIYLLPLQHSFGFEHHLHFVPMALFLFFVCFSMAGA
jgi:hypothetical protein